ncbi:hypothetical protein P1P75_09255 [Streptomyces sp. ID05-39B]|uniref:hypothetical protein n=1 Tax=Streptomyces sp. ID05-39B TaxID=3028664 RepID=UPI0029A6BCB1|nr:hypothetical protein [Streptomyces sp. ID05-39B]MDX3526623.1 hypothetical protein [Streptomyces sp. ID05-39B]
MSNAYPPAQPPPQNPYGQPAGPYGGQPAGQYGGDPTGQGGPYGPPATMQGGMQGGAYPPPAPGAPMPGTPAGPYGVPGVYGASPYAPVPAPVMPGSVRAAQIVIWVLAGLMLLVVLVWGFGSSSEQAGRLIGANLMGWVLFGLSFRYPTAGNGVRIASIVLASLQIAMSLGGLSQGNGGGGFPLIGAIVVVILLNQGSAAHWFQRPRTMGDPYGR